MAAYDLGGAGKVEAMTEREARALYDDLCAVAQRPSMLFVRELLGAKYREEERTVRALGTTETRAVEIAIAANARLDVIEVLEDGMFGLRRALERKLEVGIKK
jgi:hypothetical protein